MDVFHQLSDYLKGKIMQAPEWAEAHKQEGDVVIRDLDTSQEVDLSSIPF